MTTPLTEAIARAIKDARAFPGTKPVARLSDVDRRAAHAALTAISNAGYAVVPVEPTEESKQAGVTLAMGASLGGSYTLPDYMRDLYRAMIHAGGD